MFELFLLLSHCAFYYGNNIGCARYVFTIFHFSFFHLNSLVLAIDPRLLLFDRLKQRELIEEKPVFALNCQIVPAFPPY